MELICPWRSQGQINFRVDTVDGIDRFDGVERVDRVGRVD